MSMKLLAAAALVALPLAAQAETPDIRPGQWAFDSTTTVKGDVELPAQSNSEQQCITEADLQDADFGFIEEEEGCELLSQDMSAERMTYHMTCRAEGGEADIRGEMRFMGERIEGDVTIDADSPVGRMTMQTDIEGSYQGECTNG